MAEYTKELLAKLREEIKKAPRKATREKKLNKSGVVKNLDAEIKSMREKGYYIGEISEFLTEKGFPISKATLTAYLKPGKTAEDRES